MLVFGDLEYNQGNLVADPEKLSLTTNLFVQATKYSKSTNALKVLYFEKLLNFVRALCLYIIHKNDFTQILSEWDLQKEKDNANRIVKSFIDLLLNFDILILTGGKLVIHKSYEQMLKNRKELIDSLFGQNALIGDFKMNKLFLDFFFVKDLIKRYRDNGYEFRYIKKNRNIWYNMINEGTLDYEVRLAETLKQLSRLQIPDKIKSPFDEDYYTESGRNAFRNFTQFKFIDVFSKIVQKRDSINVLDIGCGYGNYIDVLGTNYPMFHIEGIELQENVYRETSEKFRHSNNIDIIHGDFFNYSFKKKFDVVLVNYVLFYFNAKEKSDLLNKATEILAENGSIIVCQYFSGIEDIKKNLALKQGEYSLSKKIEMFYSNKILYANTLWNDAADTFSESVKWDEFMQIISENDLKINRITNADKFYYSLFIELKAS